MRKLNWLLAGMLVVPYGLAAAGVWAQIATAPASPAAREQNSSLRYRTLNAIHVQSSLVTAPITVMDRSGNFIENLSESDFRVLDNGVPQRITRFGLAMEPVAAVIVIQTNEGVASLLEPIQRLGPLFSNLLLGPSGEAGVVTYADKAETLQSFSSDPDVLAQTLRHVIPAGSKARLNDALARAILMLVNRPKAERRVMIVFSDGFDRGSETSREEVLRASANADIAVDGLRFDPTQESLRRSDVMGANSSAEGADPLPLLEFALGSASAAVHKNLLQWYAAGTGGVVYKHWKKRTVEEQLQKIALEINSQYVLAYVPSTLNETGFHHIQIKLSRPNLRIRTRSGYFYHMTPK